MTEKKEEIEIQKELKIENIENKNNSNESEEKRKRRTKNDNIGRTFICK